MMKKILVLLMALVMFASVAMADMTPGTYEATSKGFGGEVSVKVTVSATEIIDIEITGDNETPGLGSVAVENMDEAMELAQTPDVDGVTGATVTSTAIRNAVTEALMAAGADLEAMNANRRDLAEAGEVEEVVIDVDVVVVGAGGAGMTAAITAKQAGKNVIILEKMPYTGGNTTKATGGMNAAGTHYQKEQGIEDSVELFTSDTMTGGHQKNNIELVSKLAAESADAIDWLDSIGAPLPKVSFSGGASAQRIHAPADGSGVGGYLVSCFNDNLVKYDIPLMLETTASQILMKDGAAVGVLASDKTHNYTINAKAVVLTTGGFGANMDMIAQYRPDLRGTVTTNAPGAQGEGLSMAIAVGADLVDIDEIQLHPTVEQTTSIMVTESVRGDGAILVNQAGVRFTDELKTRDYVSARELEQDGCYAYIIFDQELRENLKATEKYVKNGIVTEAATVAELAEKLGIDPAVLEKTLTDWNAAVAAQNDSEFGRTTGMNKDLSHAPYYAIKIAPGIHHCMGGVKINTDTQVIDTNGAVIPGLYAAGEVTGGVHGGNRLGGNAVADIVVYGRVAGSNASEYAK